MKKVSISPSKAADYTNVLEVVVQNTGQSMSHPQNKEMQEIFEE